ncbi:MAG: monofunctional biosynthetic peptidoglycan transglycosylase [Methylobacteriaceae bacterium]|nr:monofunctional biosynthetic peptidoglycan transglycosylase [Methylobacteriaceae bacterium]
MLFLLKVAVVYTGLVVILTLLWTFVPPVSTLMVRYWAEGRAVRRIAVPIEEISPNLVLAVLHSEDAHFCDHQGVDWDAMTRVLLRRGGPSRGASTIPMQTAKNLYLWPSRSYVRKGLEIPVTYFMSLVWSRRHVMETYLNIAEWGNGIIGAEAAARHYFKKSARKLTNQEAALMAVSLPNPLLRNPARPGRDERAKARTVLSRMYQKDTMHCVFPPKPPESGQKPPRRSTPASEGPPLDLLH